MFSAHVRGSCIHLRRVSQIPLHGDMHAQKGRNRRYQKTRNPANHRARNIAKNQRMAQRIPGQSPAPLPSPVPSPRAMICGKS